MPQSHVFIEKLRAERDELIASAESIIARAETSEHEMSASDSANLTELQNEARKLNSRIGELTESATRELEAAMRDHAFDSLKARQSELLRNPATEQAPSHLDIGAEFCASQVFTDFKAAGGGTSGVWTGEFALLKSTDSNGAPFAGVHRASDAAVAAHSTPLLDACGFEPVGSNSFDFIRFPAGPPLAGGPVAEGTAKPEATVDPVVVTDTLGKWAHTLPITTEFLEDIPRMESIVRTGLVNGVKDRVEMVTAAALVADTSIGAVSHETFLGAIRVGVARTQMAGFRAVDVALNPLDYAQIDIEMLTSTLNGASRNVGVWGLNVVPAAAIPEGTSFVGNLRQAVTVFARSQVQIRMTDSHGTEFVQNILRLVAEQRALPLVTQPAAVFRCSAEPAPAAGSETRRK